MFDHIQLIIGRLSGAPLCLLLQFVTLVRLNYGALAGWGSIVAAAVCEVCRQGCCGSHMTSSLHTAAFEAPELFTPVWAGRLESSRIERLRERGKGGRDGERERCGITEQRRGEEGGEEMSFRLWPTLIALSSPSSSFSSRCLRFYLTLGCSFSGTLWQFFFSLFTRPLCLAACPPHWLSLCFRCIHLVQHLHFFDLYLRVIRSYSRKFVLS